MLQATKYKPINCTTLGRHDRENFLCSPLQHKYNNIVNANRGPQANDNYMDVTHTHITHDIYIFYIITLCIIRIYIYYGTRVGPLLSINIIIIVVMCGPDQISYTYTVTRNIIIIIILIMGSHHSDNNNNYESLT